MQKLDTKTLDSLKRIAEYMQESEEASYAESNQDDEHIFNDVVVLQTFLDNYIPASETIPLANVENMTSPRGNREVPNQFIIYTEHGTYFKSYSSIIAYQPKDGGRMVLDINKWNYSTTTGKYRNQFLGEDIEQTRKRIKEGSYILADLNK